MAWNLPPGHTIAFREPVVEQRAGWTVLLKTVDGCTQLRMVYMLMPYIDIAIYRSLSHRYMDPGYARLHDALRRPEVRVRRYIQRHVCERGRTAIYEEELRDRR